MMKSKNLMGRLIEIAGPYPSLGCERHQAGGKATRRITPILLSLFLAFLVSLAGSVHAAQGGIPGQTTLGSLACTQDQIAKYDGSAWVCAVDESGPLSALACTQDQIAKYNGSNGAWECSDQDTGAVFIKSAGTPIALLVGDASHLIPQTSDPRSWYGLSDVDYLFQVVIDDTPLSDGIVGQMDSSVWFDQDECEGNAYV